jgi:hypothetical protein
MVRAFKELPVSDKVTSAFEKDLEQFAKEKKKMEVSSAGENIIARIERIGKGRFSQRLANKLSGRTAPDYIEDAIERITEKVKESRA